MRKMVLGMMALVAILASLAFLSLPALANGNSGDIKTTNAGGDQVNGNHYDTKLDVYLKGSNLPDGDYYCQVTSTMGTLLGTSAGSSNERPVHVAGGSFGPVQLWAILEKITDHTPGYDNTDNNGGKYKVWVSSTGDFSNSWKTDNFDVRMAAIVVVKKYDAGETTFTFNKTEGGDLPVSFEITTHLSGSEYRGSRTFAVSDGSYGLEEQPGNWVLADASVSPTSAGVPGYFHVVKGDVVTVNFENRTMMTAPTPELPSAVLLSLGLAAITLTLVILKKRPVKADLHLP